MSTPHNVSVGPAASLDQWTDELTRLVDRTKTLLATRAANPADVPRDELIAALEQLRAAAQRLQAQARPGGLADHRAALRTADAITGVAFAAGTVPWGQWRMLSLGGLGWAFAAGLLLGALLRRR